MTDAEEDLREEETRALDPGRVGAILEAVEAGDVAHLDELTEPLHPADIADLLEQIGPAERRALVALWPAGIDGDVLSELDESIREEVIEALPHQMLADAVRELDSDDVVDLIQDLEEPQQDRILGALDPSDRMAVEQAMLWPEYSAGRLMQRETVVAPEDWTAGQAIDFLRSEDWLPDQFYHVILVDPRMRPLAYVTLGRLLAARRDTPLRDITEDSFRTIPATMAEGEVAYLFNQYHLISAPVVDEGERLVGVITIDDAMAVLEEETEEDILRLGGVGDESLNDGIVETTRQRFPWLFVNLLTANLASLVVAQFEHVISVLVALAALMPIVASMGGNTGTQSLTIAVRAIATRDLTHANAWRVIRREVAVAVLNGMAFAVIMGLVAWLGYGIPRLGMVIAAAMLVNLAVAGLAGVLVPLGLNRLRLDPALASGTFVTTITDVVGFFSFLGLATLVLL